MTAILPADIITELEDAIAACSPERCARMLRQTIDLLVAGGDQLGELQIGILDDVLIRLTERSEPRGLVQLSTALAELSAAPRETLRRLAFEETG